MRLRHAALAAFALLLCGSGPKPDSAAPTPELPAAEAAARRFPQPVRVGDLVGRPVLQPLESQPVLGRVSGVVQQPDGAVDVVMDYGGFLGFGRRPIAVSVDSIALLGADVVVQGLTPAQLDVLPTFDGKTATPVSPDSTIKVGLTRPSH